jgi:hypothetical protein
MNITLNKDTEAVSVVVYGETSAVRLSDGTRIEISTKTLHDIAKKLESFEYFLAK